MKLKNFFYKINYFILDANKYKRRTIVEEKLKAVEYVEKNSNCLAAERFDVDVKCIMK